MHCRPWSAFVVTYLSVVARLHLIFVLLLQTLLMLCSATAMETFWRTLTPWESGQLVSLKPTVRIPGYHISMWRWV